MELIKRATIKFRFLMIRIVCPKIIGSVYRFLPRKDKTLLLIKNDGIGDYVLFRNYIEVLKRSEKFGAFKIYVLANKTSKDLAIHLDSDSVNGFFWYSGDSFLKWKLLGLIFDLQRLRLDTILYTNYSRNYPVDWLVHNINAINKIGVDGDTINEPPSLKLRADKYYTQLIAVGKEPVHEFDRNKQIIEKLTGEKCELLRPVIDKDYLNIDYHNSIVVFPGANDSARRWAASNFNKLCNLIISNLKINIIFAGGKDGAGDRDEIYSGLPAGSFLNQNGMLNIVQLCEVIAGSKLLISNDTVAVHIAVALDIPVVCISKGDLYGRFISYPGHIYDKIHAIFPQDFIAGCESYHQFSASDINTITPEHVYNLIGKQFGPA